MMVRERTDWAMEPQPKVTSRKVPAVAGLNTAARRGGRATVVTGTCSGHCYTLGQYNQDVWHRVAKQKGIVQKQKLWKIGKINIKFLKMKRKVTTTF